MTEPVLRWLHSLAEMDAVASAWRQLDQESTADFVWFQSFHWCRAWMSHHAGRSHLPRVLMIVAGDRARAIVPFMITRNRFGVRLLTIIGAPHSQYANVITADGSLSPEDLQAMRNAIRDLKGVDALMIDLVPMGSPMAQLLGAELLGEGQGNEAALLNLKEFSAAEGFEATLSKHARKELRRRRRLLDEASQAVTFQTLRPGAPEYAATISHCVAAKKEWITSTGRISRGLGFDNHDQFLSALAMQPNGDGPIVWSLQADGRAIATEIGFLQRGHYYCYMASFDWSLRNLAPGKLQKSMTIDALIANGSRTFDLMANPTDYKKEYSNATLMLGEAVVPYTLRGRLYVKLWEKRLFPMLKSTFNAMPDSLRQRVAKLRQLNLTSAQPR